MRNLANELLGSRFACECGREHLLPIRQFVYEPGAVDALGEIVREASGAKRAVVVADVRTWEVCGRRALNVLRRSGCHAEQMLVADGPHDGPVCDDATFGALLPRLREAQADVVVAVGSGVINDLCKWTSFELGLPYVVVATAASMNGYAAANVAARIDGVKVLVEARPPVAVIAEPAVIEQAPREMTTAGFGDTIAKYQSNTDWAMDNLLSDEYYCGFCAGIVNDIEHLYLDHPEDVAKGNSRAVGGLFEALFWTGAAMTLVGTSAPASGGEHLLSHTLDMAADVHQRRHDLHGRQVGIGTLFSAALYERILALEAPAPASLPARVDRAFWSSPPVFEAIAKQYEAKRANLEIAARSIAKSDVWDRLRACVAPLTKSPATIQDWLRRAGGALTAADIGCSREQLASAVLHMHEIRKRFTVVDLAWLVGALPGAADEIIDEWLIG
ncbi:MAG: sn-glycerol-1-phosphate dehydrogenase [Sedimentisphaerales bacterium]|nr:sn-glycerol-1-phosphate dehydrogenase [Sedimentisphaerales bacterium]